MFRGLGSGTVFTTLLLFCCVFGLVLIGGLALLCFTKAFGTVFLGTPRSPLEQENVNITRGRLVGMYAVLAVMLAIGLFPGFFIRLLSGAVGEFTAKLENQNFSGSSLADTMALMQQIGYCALGFILLATTVLVIRNFFTRRSEQVFRATWGCGYTGSAAKMQYTGSSFVRSYIKLVKPVLSIHKAEKFVMGIFPSPAAYQTHPSDKMEESLIDVPLRKTRYFFSLFSFLQNGKPQLYVLYGVLFIVLVIGMPHLLDALNSFLNFLISL
jgi:hypothetical protein